MKSRLYYAVICYILAAVLLFLCVPIVHRISYPKTQAIRTVKVLEKGEQITGEDIQKVTIGALNLPGDVIETSNDALGRYAAVDIVEGDILYLSKLSQLPMDGDVPKDILPAENSVAFLRLQMMEGSEYPLPEMGDVIKLNLFGKKLTDIPELQFVRVLSVIPREAGEETVSVTVSVNEAQKKYIDRHREGTFYASVIVRSNEELAEKLLQEQEAFFKEG